MSPEGPPRRRTSLSKIGDSSAHPRGEFHEYLHALMRADLGRRLMFGSDSAGPGAVTAGIAGIASAAFLSASERRDILCDNAARFYRLDARARPAARGAAPR